jgi:methyl-accepting chemotaxis protein
MDSTITILTILVTLIGVFGLLQVIFLAIIALAVKKGMKEMSDHAGEIKARVNPLIDESKLAVAQAKEALAHSKGVMDQAKSLIARIEPKLEMAAGELAEITHTVSDEAKNLQRASTEISDRFRRQALRLETFSNRTFDGVDKAGHFVGNVVSNPMRQVSGVVAAAKAIMDTIRKGSGQRSSPRVHTTPIRDERTAEQRAERTYYTGPEAKVR